MTASALPAVRRWGGLDGLRAVAVAAVLGFHFAPHVVPGGFLGVDVFFALSGYLITRMIVSEYLARDCFEFRRFYLRRGRRLLPALAIVLLSCLAAAACWRDQLVTIRPATLAAVGYVSNWWLSYAHQSYFVAAGRPSMLQHLWSLAVEEQFYLLWPVLVIGLLNLTGRRSKENARRWVAAVAILLALVSALETYLWAAAMHAPYAADASRLYYGTDTHSMGLLLGAALGALAAAAPRPFGLQLSDRGLPVALTDAVAAAALVGLVVMILAVDDATPWLYRTGFLLCSLLAAAAAAAAARPTSHVGRLLDGPPQRWLAARSYAIYLWHWPIAVVTRPGIDLSWPAPAVFILRIGLTLALADVTYRGVELPIRQVGLRGSLANGADRVVRVLTGRAPVGARLIGALGATVLLAAATVLAIGPRAGLSAGQRALAAARGGRNLGIGGVGGRPAPRVTVRPPRPVRPAGATDRTATAQPPTTRAPAASTSALPPLSAYGDSVLLGARTAIASRFAGGRMDAVEGRQADPILSDVQRDARAHRLNPIVVIHVGDNGLITGGQLRRTLQALGGVERVILLTDHVDRPWEGPNNRTITQVAQGFDNVRVVDWDAIAARHPRWLYDDQIHLTPRGATGYADLLAQAVRLR